MFTLPRLTADEVGKESRVESHFRLPLTHAPSPSPSSSLCLSLSHSCPAQSAVNYAPLGPQLHWQRIARRSLAAFM